MRIPQWFQSYILKLFYVSYVILIPFLCLQALQSIFQSSKDSLDDLIQSVLAPPPQPTAAVHLEPLKGPPPERLSEDQLRQFSAQLLSSDIVTSDHFGALALAALTCLPTKSSFGFKLLFKLHNIATNSPPFEVDPTIEEAIYYSLMKAYYHRGRLDIATAMLEAFKPKPKQAIAQYLFKGVSAYNNHDWDGALAAFQASIAAQSSSQTWLSLALLYRGRRHAAAELVCHYRILSDDTSPEDQIGALNNIADVYRDMRQLELAGQFYLATYRLAKEANDDRRKARVLESFAYVLLHQGRVGDSVIVSQKALEAYRQLGDLEGFSEVCMNLGTALFNIGMKSINTRFEILKQAEFYFKQGLNATSKLTSVAGFAVALGNICYTRGQLGPMLTHWEEAMTTFEADYRPHIGNHHNADIDIRHLDNYVCQCLFRMSAAVIEADRLAHAFTVARLMHHGAASSFRLRLELQLPSSPAALPPLPFAASTILYWLNNGAIFSWFADGVDFEDPNKPPPNFHFDFFVVPEEFTARLKELTDLKSEQIPNAFDLKCFYDLLIKPWEQFLPQGNLAGNVPTLVIVPLGQLAVIPFAALAPTSHSPPLVSRVALCQVPSLGVFQALRRRILASSVASKYAIGPISASTDTFRQNPLATIIYNLQSAQYLYGATSEHTEVAEYLKRLASSTDFDGDGQDFALIDSISPIHNTDFQKTDISRDFIRSMVEKCARSEVGLVCQFSVHSNPKVTPTITPLGPEMTPQEVLSSLAKQSRLFSQHNSIGLQNAIGHDSDGLLLPSDVMSWNLAGLPLVFLNSCGSTIGFVVAFYLLAKC